jgi:hypothetical protein
MADEGRPRISAGNRAAAQVVVSQQLARQPFDDHLRYETAAVVAHIDDQARLAQLRVVPLDELAHPVGPHVRDVQVTDLAATGLGDVVAVVPHPVVVVQWHLALDRPDQQVARAVRRGPAVDGELDQLAGCDAQQAVRAFVRGQRLAVDRQHGALDPGEVGPRTWRAGRSSHSR